MKKCTNCIHLQEIADFCGAEPDLSRDYAGICFELTKHVSAVEVSAFSVTEEYFDGIAVKPDFVCAFFVDKSA